jgi:hypothetical protein
MTIVHPSQQLGAPQMNKYTMSGITSSGVLAGALLGPFIFSALSGSAESPVAAVRRNLVPMIVGGLIGGALLGSGAGGLWLYQRGQ